MFYACYRTKIGHVKIYHQFKRVNYADYLINMVYIAKADLQFEGELYEEVNFEPLPL